MDTATFSDQPYAADKSTVPHAFQTYVNPYLSELLSALELDKRFVEGIGCELIDETGRRFLDCISAYGALPFGFNPPEIWRAIHQICESNEPSLVQPSFLNAAGELAKRLIELAPADLQYVTFANSGAEAVEAAIKMSRAATGRTKIVATDNGFHGKTLGALAATGNPEYQQGFASPVEQFFRIPFGDASALESLLTQHAAEIAAVIIEPIQGEAGIVEPPSGYWTEVRRLCNEHDVLLIFDEIQTGLGRTGKLFCCEHENVSPDIMTLAKALGGGLLPIGAVLSNERAFSRDFALKHSSTFAGNTLACRAGLAALDVLAANDGSCVESVRTNGQRLKKRLSELAQKFPHLVSEVRGRGYLLGISLCADRMTWPESLLGVAAEQSLLAPVFASYLLNVEGIRVAPTMNGRSVIRIEPSLTFTWDQCEQLLTGVENALSVFSDGNTGQILSSILSGRPCQVSGQIETTQSTLTIQPKPSEKRFAFLTHPLDSQGTGQFDPHLRWLPDELLADVTDRLSGIVEPFVQSHARVTSESGESIYGEFIVVPNTAKQLAEMPRAQAVARVQAAIEVAKQRGAQIVGLGAFTSVVTRGGKSVAGQGMPLTTGNSYTAVASAEGIRLAMAKLGDNLGATTCAAVIGATGAIGRAMSCLLAEDVGQLILVGNPKSNPQQVERRLARVAAGICQHVVDCMLEGQQFADGSLASQVASLVANQRKTHGRAQELDWDKIVDSLIGDAYILTTQDLNAVASANVVVTATSATDSVLNSTHLQFGALVCDLSRPRNINEAVQAERPDVLVFDGGLVAIPGNPQLGSFGLDRGQAFSCMAETMLLTLAGHFQDTSLGTDLSSANMRMLRTLAQEHGFRIAKIKSFGNSLTRFDWRRIRDARMSARRHAGQMWARDEGSNWLEDSSFFPRSV